MAHLREAVVGIDLGGTKTRVGLVFTDSQAELASIRTFPTPKNDPEKGLRDLVSIVASLVSKDVALKAVGIGAPGPYDSKAGRYSKLPNLPAWQDYPIRDRLRAMLGVPVALENDANVAAVGEHRFGAGRGVSDMIYVTIGTGIGGALILGGRLYTGRSGYAGEVGHLIVEPGGVLCGCGRRGCLETLASGPAIERAAAMPTKDVFSLAAQGDRRAVQILRAAGRALGQGLTPLVTVLDPEIIVIGGGMATGDPSALDIYLSAAREFVEANAFLPEGEEVRFALAELGDSSGMLGAAYLAILPA